MKIIQIKSEFEDIALNLLEENNILYENVTYKYSANKQKSSDYDEKFMIEDFKESYQMLRHYDDVNWSIMKFCFSQVIIIIGAGWTFDIAFKKQVDGMFSLFSSYPYIILGSIFMLSTLFVLLSIIAIAKNRTYFTKTSRFLNENRDIVFKGEPLGFENKSGMWHNVAFPKTADYSSTQLICLYLAYICGMLMAFLSVSIFSSCIYWGILAAFIFIVVAILLTIKIFSTK